MHFLVEDELASMGLKVCEDVSWEAADVLITDSLEQYTTYIEKNPEGLCLALSANAVVATSLDVPFGKPDRLPLPYVPECVVRAADSRASEEFVSGARGARSPSYRYSLPWLWDNNSCLEPTEVTNALSAEYARSLDQRRYSCLSKAAGPRVRALGVALEHFRRVHGRWPLLHTDYDDCGPEMRAGALKAVVRQDREEMASLLEGSGMHFSVAVARRYEGARGLRKAEPPPDFLREGALDWRHVPCTSRNRVASLAALEAAKYVSGTGCVSYGEIRL